MASRNLALPLSLPDNVEIQSSPHDALHTASCSLWLCLYFPHFCLQVLPEATQDQPQMLVSDVAGRWLVHTANALAEDFGVMPNMSMNAAYALCPDILTCQRDPQREERQLKRLADWTYQYSSMVSLIEPQTLLLEVQGSLRLFDNLPNLLKRLQHDLENNWQITSHYAISPSPTASQMLAQSFQSIVLEDNAKLRATLAEMPINCLLLNDDKLLTKLNNIGAATLQDLWRLPRDGLMRRFGQKLLTHLDKLLGIIPDPQKLYQPPAKFDERLELPYEASSSKIILYALEKLLIKLEDFLRERDAGVTELFIDLYYFNAEPKNIALGFRQNTRNAKQLLSLCQTHFEKVTLTDKVCDVRLTVKSILPFNTISQSLFPTMLQSNQIQPIDPDWENTLEQLQNKFGQTSVLNLALFNDHRPENAWSYQQQTQTNEEQETRLRPLWLLPKPQSLIVRNTTPWRRGPLYLVSGPERIESGWWQGKDICRDYYIARDTDNSQLWIFQDLKDSEDWYLHGLFG